MMKKTIAVLRNSGEFSPLIMEILLQQDLRLLFVSEDKYKNEKLEKQLEAKPTVAEIDFITCEREGCWEAEIIIVNQSDKFSYDLIEKIKEVATQKIVLSVSEDAEQSDYTGLEKLLPFSKLVKINFDHREKEFSVFARDFEAKTEVLKIFGNSDYKLNNQEVW